MAESPVDMAEVTKSGPISTALRAQIGVEVRAIRTPGICPDKEPKRCCQETDEPVRQSREQPGQEVLAS